MADFKRRDVEEFTTSLAAYMPNDELFASKSIRDSNFRKFLRGLSWELYRANGFLREYADGVIPDRTEKFLDEWESALGIPDGCFTGAGSLDDRRRDVLIKLASLGVQTADDFVALAAMFGVTVTVRPGRAFSTFPLEFPILLFDTVKESRFTLVVDFTVQAANVFPMTFPIIFGTETLGTLECLFRRLKPANCNILFRQV